MAGFLSPLKVERLNGGNKWKVLEKFEYCVGSPTGMEVVTVPEGFVTDFASIPRGLWNIFPPVGGKYDKAAVIHDKMYKEPKVEINGLRYRIDRTYADEIFKEAMGVLEVGWFSRWAIYLAVRMGGWVAWNNHRQETR